MASLQGLGAKGFDTSIASGGILEHIRSTFQPICHISHSSSTAKHLAAAAVCISSFNYMDLQAYINYISFTFQAFINLQVSASTMHAKGKGGHGKGEGKKTAKPKAILPSLLSSDDDHDDQDDHDEHDDATPDVFITSTPTTPPELPVEPPSKKSKKIKQLTAEGEDDMSEWLKDNSCIYNKKLD